MELNENVLELTASLRSGARVLFPSCLLQMCSRCRGCPGACWVQVKDAGSRVLGRAGENELNGRYRGCSEVAAAWAAEQGCG